MKKKILIISAAVLGIILFGYLADLLSGEKSDITAPQYAGDEDIVIFSPLPNEKMESPYRVQGQARGNWYFEASFPVMLTDGEGKVIASVPAAALSDWMTDEFVTFQAELVFATPKTQTGYAVFKKDNPSGLPENDKEIRVPVTFSKELPGETREVFLYYYNKEEDKKLSGGENVLCDEGAVTAVLREMPKTISPIKDTLTLLIAGNLTDEERGAGFETEFPNKDFKLLGANLKEGALTLRFSEVPGFTAGGSCRIGLLRAQIEKTARQFPGVEKVIFEPESLFQP